MQSDAPTAGFGAAGLLDRLAADRPRTLIALLLLGLMLFLPGFFSLPPVDRDEARFAQASKQMVETGNYVDIRFRDQPRYLKPIGIYWLQSASVLLSGAGTAAPIWVYRLPSLIGALAALGLLYWAALGLGPPHAALVATLLFSATFVLGVEARLAKTDAMLLATVLAAQGALARLLINPENVARGRWRFVFWSALGLGGLIKGPIAAMVAGLTCAGICIARRSLDPLRVLRPVSGIALMLAIVLPWIVAIAYVSGGEFFQAALGRDLFGKLHQAQESHGAPPGAHLLASFMTYWPLTPLLFLAMPWIWRNRTEPAVLFCLMWLLPSWLVFEIVATKLPHYTMPLAPAAAILLGLAAVRGAARLQAWWQELGLALCPLIAVLIALAAFAVPSYLQGHIILPGGILMLSFAVLAVIAWLHARRGAIMDAVTYLVVGAVLYAWAGYGLIAPSLASLWISPRLAAAVNAAQPDCAKVKVAASGYHEPSLVFLAGTDTLLVHEGEAAAFLAAGPCHVALVEKRREETFLAALKATGAQYRITGRVSGIALNGLEPMDIGIYVSKGEARGERSR